MTEELMTEESTTEESTKETVGVLEAARRGLCRRCPHCGKGPLFRTWFKLHETCSVCGFKYERNHGDTWAFWLLGDRIFVVGLLALVFFGFRSHTWEVALTAFLVFLIPLIWTMPNRMGVCIGIDYVSRVLWGPPEEIPELPEG